MCSGAIRNFFPSRCPPAQKSEAVFIVRFIARILHGTAPTQKSDQIKAERRGIRFLREDHFGLSPLISSSQLQPSEYFSRAMISTEGFCLPHSIRWRELRSRSAFSASFSCVSPAAFRKRETFFPNATTVLLRPSTRKVTQNSESRRAADMRLSFPWRFIGLLIRDSNDERPSPDLLEMARRSLPHFTSASTPLH